jgi:orotate phosphoribosyltransferase
MRQQDVWEELVENGAVWHYPKDPRSPHPRLREGQHSDGFIDTLAYISVVENMEASARSLARALRKHLAGQRIDWVIGSPMAAIPFATAVGMELRAKRVGFTEKVKGTDELECRFDMEPGSRVLQIDEMTTTGVTPQRSIEAVLAKNPGVEIIPFAGVIVAREPREKIHQNLTSATLVSLVNTKEIDTGMHEWDVKNGEECPLCKAGSPILTNIKRVWWDLHRNMQDPAFKIPNAMYA